MRRNRQTRRSRREQPKRTFIGLLTESWLNILLIFVPVSVVLELIHAPEVWVFASTAAAIIPLAGLIGSATELLSARVGPAMGGLLNATFGNATELIVALFALSAGLQEVVKASITGSVLSNILLVLGISMIAGGWGREKQTFNRTHAGANASMLFLAIVALVLPAVFDLVVYGSLRERSPVVDRLSEVVAGVLLLTYLASVGFALKTRQILFASTPTEEPESARASLATSIMLLGVATALTAYMSEILVGVISAATESLGMTQFFVGVVVIAIVGNAAEHYSAVVMARKNKMDLAVTICTASGTQIALFVAPVLVFSSMVIGKPLSLVFNAFEVVSLALGVLVLSIVSLDGESNWFEGLQLTAVYLVMAVVFYFVPG